MFPLHPRFFSDHQLQYQAIETVHIKTGESTKLTVKACNDGQCVGVSTGLAVQKIYAIFNIHFKAKAIVNTAEN